MNPFKPTDWEKHAFRVGFSMAVSVLVLFLIVDGINWLISGKKPSENLLWVTVATFCGMYFNTAINSIHERLSEVDEAINSVHERLREVADAVRQQ